MTQVIDSRKIYRVESTWDSIAAVRDQGAKLYLVLAEGNPANAMVRAAVTLTPPGFMVTSRPDLLAQGHLIDLAAFR